MKIYAMKDTVLRMLFASSLIFFIQESTAAPIIANPARQVTLVEYYDYECPHCRKMEPIIESLEKEYSNLHVMYRVTPLLTPASYAIASVVLSAKAQNKKGALTLHLALMRMNHTPTLADALRIADKLGFSVNTLFSVTQNRTIQNKINQNIISANAYAINGAIYFPIFVFSKSNGRGEPIILRGEQSRALLSAIVRQLGGQYVSMVQKKTATKQSSPQH